VKFFPLRSARLCGEYPAAMMAIPTLVIAILLILVGAGGYVMGHPDPGASHVSYTALIPAAVGVVLGLLGAIALCEKARMHAMHAAAMVGLLAAVGDGMQLIKTLGNTTTAPDVRQLKIISMSATLILCVVFLVLCVRSFIQARKNRLAGK
jgi:hypothetical protein